MKHIGNKVKVCRGGSNFVTMGNQIIFRSLAILVGLEIIDFRKSHSGLLSRDTPLHFLASWNKLKLLQQFIVSHLLTAVSSGTSVRRSRPVSWEPGFTVFLPFQWSQSVDVSRETCKDYGMLKLSIKL